MSASITPSELARLLGEALPVRGRVEITAGDPASLAAGDHFVVTEDSDGGLAALMRAVEIGADGKTGDLNVKTWVIVPAAARARPDVVRAVMRVWPRCMLRFVEATDEQDHPWLVTPEFFEPSAAYQEPLTTDEDTLRTRLDTEFARRLEVVTTTDDGWGEG